MDNTPPTEIWGGSSATMQPVCEAAGGVLHDYFVWATTATMARYQDSAEDVPNGLQIPKRSWNGLVQ